MVRDSMEIADDVAEDERCRVPIRYYSVTHSREETITSCEGDLIVICNVLADYADMLDELLRADRDRLGFCGALQYERMRDRCRKRAGRTEKADAGIGEDALVLSARRRAGMQQKAEQPATGQ